MADLTMLVTRLQAIETRREVLVSEVATLEGEVATITEDIQELAQAETLLKEYVTYRKSSALLRVAGTLTRGLQAVFHPGISATMGDAENGTALSTSNAKLMTIRVTTHGVSQDVRKGCGRSVRAVIDYLLWLDLFTANQRTYGYRPFVCWDEPFLALHPARYPKVQALLAGLADIGVQVIVCTNQVGMIPDGALVHSL